MRKKTYKLTTYVPDPRGRNNNFTYDDLIDIEDGSLNPFEDILDALATHISEKFNVRVQRKSFIVQYFALHDEAAEIAAIE